MNKNKKILFFTFIFLIAILLLLLFNGGVNLSRLISAVSFNYKDRIHEIFINDRGSSLSAEAILIESQGKYGLIDTGNSSGDPSPYNIYDYSFNGNDVANYLKSNGVTRLDFVILTHDHCDHVGGVPILIDKGYIDKNTTIIYRNYNNVNSEEVEGYTSYYYNKSINKAKKVAKMLEISDHSSSNLSKIGASYVNTTGTYSDHIKFNFGNLNISLFNINNYTNADAENRKSIVTLITKGSKKALLMSESINVYNAINEIANYVGKVDFIKIGHYDNRGSIPLHLLTKTKPDIAILTGNLAKNKTLNYDDGIALAYFNTEGGLLIGNEDKRYPLVISFEDNKVYLYQNKSQSFIRISSTTINAKPKTGWVQLYDSKALNENNLVWVHINSNYKLSSGFITSGGKRYYLNEASTDTISKGVMVTGWKKINGYWYYMNPTKTNKYVEGEVLTGWQQIKGNWYYFDTGSSPIGKMVTGLKKINNKWYYFQTADDGKDLEGIMLSNAYKTIGGIKMYFNKDGYTTNLNGVVPKPTSSSYCISKTYDGSAQTITKSPSSGYTFSNNIKTAAGTYSVTAILSSGYLWSDYTSANVTFNCTISAKSISSVTVTVPKATYTGSALTPAPTVKDGSKTLTKNTDYTVTYNNNINAGKATITITGKNNYIGTKKANFIIESDDIVIDDNDKMYIEGNYLKVSVNNSSFITKGKLIENIRDTTGIEIYNSNGQALSNNEFVPTGSSIKKNNKSYNIIVLGDVNKDARINITDIIKIYNDLSIINNGGTSKFSTIQNLAADLSENGTKDITDIIKIYRIMKANN